MSSLIDFAEANGAFAAACLAVTINTAAASNQMTAAGQRAVNILSSGASAVYEKQAANLLEVGSQPSPLALASLWSKLTWTMAVSWLAQITVAIILAQTLFFKFTYAPETQLIFASRGGRPAATALGLIELICVVLLLIPRTATWGAVLSLAVISGAIFTHLTSLGIAIVDPATGQSDRGLLFGLAVTVAIGSLIILACRWRQLPWVAWLPT